MHNIFFVVFARYSSEVEKKNKKKKNVAMFVAHTPYQSILSNHERKKWAYSAASRRKNPAKRKT